MKKFTRHLLLFSLLYMVVSCVKSPDGPEPDEIALDITMRAPESSGNDAAISNARIIIFDNNGKIISNNKKTGVGIKFKEIVTPGLYHVFLFANELTEWNLGSIQTRDQIKSLVMNFSAYPAVESTGDVTIPMAGIYENLTIDQNGNLTHKGASLDLVNLPSVTRLFAKVSLKLSCLFSNLPDNTDTHHTNTLRVESIKVESMPKKSWLSPKSYTPGTPTDFFSGANADLITKVKYDLDNTTVKDRGFTSSFVFYIPEYLLSDVKNYTYLSIICHLADSPSTKSTYKLAIGNGIATNSIEQMKASVEANDFRIDRNTMYVYDCTIKGFGERDGLEVFQEVTGWDDKALPGNVIYRTLNLSTIFAKVNEYQATRIYFWSNQKNVFIEEEGYIGTLGDTGMEFSVNDEFVELAGAGAANFHYLYDEDTRSGLGHFDISPIDRSAEEEDRNHCIVINAGGLKRQIAVITKVEIKVPETMMSENPWVGTFHRKDQVGERIIHAHHEGAWSAEVEDPNGIGHFVVLSTSNSEDNLLFTDRFGDAEKYPVKNGKKKVAGTGRISFRVGLTSTTSVNRYARVLLKYIKSDSPTQSYIYVRQGEDADDINHTTKWSPYNIKHPTKFEGTLDWYTHPILDLSSDNRSVFTDFPTNTGSLYHTEYNATGDRKSRVFHPTYPGVGIAIEGWGQTTNNIVIVQGACPGGYRVPSDLDYHKYTEPNAPGLLSGAWEYRAWGSYADGYFDRHTPIDGEYIFTKDGDLASRGLLVFRNTHPYKSVFLPLGSNRGVVARDGKLTITPKLCFYGCAKEISLGDYQAYRYMKLSIDAQYKTHKPFTYGEIDPWRAVPIRCVKM